MNHVPLDEVVFTVVNVLAAHAVDYALIGALAVNAYGFARATQDVDLCLALAPDERERVLDLLADLGRAGLRYNPEAVARRLDEGRALLTCYQGLTRVDLFLRRERDGWGSVLSHRRVIRLGARDVWVASPEDLVATKLLAARPRDLEDARGVVDVLGSQLDVERVRAILTDLESGAEPRRLLERLLGTLTS